jgi:quercetin dioxygenase-like cupin family protein
MVVNHPYFRGDNSMFFDTETIAEATAPGPHARGAKLLFDRRTIANAPLSMALFRFSRGQIGPAHHHDTEVEVYYGLEGRGTVILDGEEYELLPHTALYIPPGKTHETRNPASEDFVFLAIFSPAVNLDFIRDWKR